MYSKLNRSEINLFLRKMATAHICFYDKIMNHLVPVWYFHDKEYIYGYSTMRNKMEKIVKDSVVCFEVNELVNPGEWKEVSIWGKYEELHDTENIRKVSSGFCYLKDGFTEPENIFPINYGKGASVVSRGDVTLFRIRVNHIIGYKNSLHANEKMLLHNV